MNRISQETVDAVLNQIINDVQELRGWRKFERLTSHLPVVLESLKGFTRTAEVRLRYHDE